MGLAIILIIIFIIYASYSSTTINNLKMENKALKKKLQALSAQKSKDENISKMSEDLNKQEIFKSERLSKQVASQAEQFNKQVVPQNAKNERKVLTEEEKIRLQKIKEKQEYERKNTTILTVGSILIVLAAIVFLMSTWNAISNVLKTIIMVLLIGVFWGASEIAKNKFKLEKTSKTFFYIAMAYIPICLISCSIFGLFGEYLSIQGQGKFIYLAISMLFTAVIYYLNYKSKNEKGLLCGSLLSQIAALVLFGLIFEKNILFITIWLLAYNIFLVILTKRESNIELLKYFYNGIPYISGIILFLQMLESSIYMMVIIPLLAINFFLLQLKKENTVVNSYLFNIALYFFGIYISTIYETEISINIRLIFAIVYVFSALIIENLLCKNDENIRKSSMIVSVASLGIIYLNSLFEENAIVKPYIISIFEIVLMLMIFMKSKTEGKTVLGYLIPITTYLTVWNILDVLNSSYKLYMLVTLLIFVVGECIGGKEYVLLRNGFFKISHTFIIGTYLICSLDNWNKISNDVLFFIMLGIVYLYSFLTNEKNSGIFKYLGYVTLGLILATGCNFIGMSDDIKLLIPFVITVIVILIESDYKYLKDSCSRLFITISSLVSYCCLISLGEVIGVFLALLLSIYLIYDNMRNQDSDGIKAIPMIAFLITLMLTGIEEEFKIIFSLIASIGLSICSISRKNISVDIIFSFIYILYCVGQFDNAYIQPLIVLVWSITNMYFIENEKSKDLLKVIAYLSGLNLYNTIIADMNLDEYVAFEIIGILIITVLILRKIVVKYFKDIDSLEYLAYICIYLAAISSYLDEKDGMIFILFVVGILIYSYIKKYGILFVVSAINILLNAILLTREFWASIPWWIYLLLVGSILIAFAIKNESDDKKEKLNVGNVIKNIRDRVEK